MWAVSYGRTAMVESLLAQGAQVNFVNKVGQQLLGLHSFIVGNLCVLEFRWNKESLGANPLQSPCSFVALFIVERGH